MNTKEAEIRLLELQAKELETKELIERLEEIADQLAYTPNCEWADDVRLAAYILKLNYITNKF